MCWMVWKLGCVRTATNAFGECVDDGLCHDNATRCDVSFAVVCRIDGSTTSRQQQEYVLRFQSDPECQVWKERVSSVALCTSC